MTASWLSRLAEVGDNIQRGRPHGSTAHTAGGRGNSPGPTCQPPGPRGRGQPPGFRLHGKSWVSVIHFLLLPLGPHLFNSVTLFKNLSKYFRPEVVKTEAQRLNSGRSISELPAVSGLSQGPELCELCSCPSGHNGRGGRGQASEPEVCTAIATILSLTHLPAWSLLASVFTTFTHSFVPRKRNVYAQ